MKATRSLPICVLLVATLATAAGAHDLFLKLPTHFLEPDSRAVIALLNGTFEQSENAIARERMRDVSIVAGDGSVTHPPADAWEDRAVHDANPDSVDTSFLTFEVGAPGTYVIGVSTTETTFELSAEDFNEYLEHDGVLDVLERRGEQGILDRAAVERYSKHVKALAQVGDARTDSYWHQLHYPAEFVPLRNPYELSAGDELEVRFLAEGHPVPGQLVYASHEGYHGHDEEGGHVAAFRGRTDAEGDIRIPITEPGVWYVRTIHMVELPDEPEVDYESNWATLTFEVR